MRNLIFRLFRRLFSDRIEDELDAAQEAIATVVREDMTKQVAKAYLDGITDGCALVIQKPGTRPRMIQQPEGVAIKERDFWTAIDRAEMVGRNYHQPWLPPVGTLPAVDQGIALRGDELREVMTRNNQT